MRSFYDEHGFLNVRALFNYNVVFNYIWGGRGTGKTYGILKYCIDNNLKFIYMRSLDSQMKLSRRIEMTIFKRINRDTGWNIIPSSLGSDSIFGMYKADKENNIQELVGYCVSLSTCANVRGIDFSDVDLIFYDEFIPKVTEKKVAMAGFAFNEFYETVNRNRELLGEHPVKCFLATNSNRLECDMFMYKKIMGKVSEMTRECKSISVLADRNIALFNLCDSPISEEKKNTALYQSEDKNSDFYAMAINNDFYNADYSGIKSRPLKEFVPLCAVGEIVIYEHKSKQLFYVTSHSSGTPDTYAVTSRDIRAFRRNYVWLYELYLDSCVEFENITVKALFEYYFREYKI